MNHLSLTVVVAAFLLVAAVIADRSRQRDRYLLEQGVPHCEVYEYDCSGDKEVGQDD